MSNLLDLLIAGLATGAIYAIVAVGFTLLWQTSQTINFAQGEFVMLPAFLMLAAMHAGVPFWLAIIIGMLLSMLLLGLGFKLLLVDPMLRHGVLPLAIATMALAIGIKEAVKQFFSAEASPFPSIVPGGDIAILGRQVSVQSLGVLALAIAAVIGLTALLNRTSIGHQMQATAQNPTVARIIGIPVERMILLTFLINAFLVALASLLITPIYLAKFSSGEVLGQAAFIAAIVGGFNQVRGAIAGGLLIGVVDNLAAAYVSTQYRAAVPMILLIAIILLRPQGLLGRELTSTDREVACDRAKVARTEKGADLVVIVGLIDRCMQAKTGKAEVHRSGGAEHER
jgi:branched-chain amino acid transport system permease protein